MATSSGAGTEDDVGDRLGEDPAEPEHHRRPELRIAKEPGDQFAIATDHRRHEQADRPVVGTRRGEQVGRGPHHAGGIAERQANETAFGLVGDRLTDQLDDDRVADL